MEDILKDAIRQLRTLKLVYSGEERLVEPYTFGRTSTGKEALRCFQIEGGSVSGTDAGWKLLVIDKIEDIELLDENFEIHEQYRMNDRVMQEIYSQVEI